MSKRNNSATKGSDALTEMMRLWLDGTGQAAADGISAAGWDRAGELFQAWAGNLSAAGPTAVGSASPFDPSEWLKPADPTGMAMIAGLIDGDVPPGTADEGSLVAEWRRFQVASDRHRTITTAAWMAASREFAERSRRAVADASRLGNPEPGWDDIAALWQEIADAEFVRTQRSDAYLEAQAGLLEAGIRLRRRAREQVEEMAALAGLPTRKDFDDLAAEVDRLRRSLPPDGAG